MITNATIGNINIWLAMPMKRALRLCNKFVKSLYVSPIPKVNIINNKDTVRNTSIIIS